MLETLLVDRKLNTNMRQILVDFGIGHGSDGGKVSRVFVILCDGSNSKGKEWVWNRTKEVAANSRARDIVNDLKREELYEILIGE